MFVSIAWVLALSTAAQADFDPSALPTHCAAEIPAAQVEYSAIEAALNRAAVPAEQLANDTRRIALTELRRALLQTTGTSTKLDRIAELSRSGNQYSREFNDLHQEVRNQANLLAIVVMQEACQLATQSHTYGRETYTETVCAPSGLRFPSIGRSSRSLIQFHSRSFEDSTPVLRTCDEIETPEVSAQVRQCLEMDVMGGQMAEKNLVYVPVPGLIDGCWGDPSAEMPNFEAYFQHRMRSAGCWNHSRILEEEELEYY